MKYTELMEKIIEKAENNGWKKPLWVNTDKYVLLVGAHYTDLHIRCNGQNKIRGGDFVKFIYKSFIFDHKFARAFFGRFWKFHLMMLVLKKDPFGTLEKYL